MDFISVGNEPEATGRDLALEAAVSEEVIEINGRFAIFVGFVIALALLTINLPHIKPL